MSYKTPGIDPTIEIQHGDIVYRFRRGLPIGKFYHLMPSKSGNRRSYWRMLRSAELKLLPKEVQTKLLLQAGVHWGGQQEGANP